MTNKERAQLHARCFTVPRPWSATEFEDLLSNPRNFLCQHQHGFLIGRLAGPEAEMLTLAVDPDHRRGGVGSALVAEFEEVAKQAGADQLFLEVAAGNTAAIQLYFQVGFQPSGIRKSYYSGPEGLHVDAVVYTKILSIAPKL